MSCPQKTPLLRESDFAAVARPTSSCKLSAVSPTAAEVPSARQRFLKSRGEQKRLHQKRGWCRTSEVAATIHTPGMHAVGTPYGRQVIADESGALASAPLACRPGGVQYCFSMPMPQPSAKRTRRGGRGRTRRRGRKGRETTTLLGDSGSELYPWWYAHMVESGRTPTGISPSAEDGFPVILPSTQCVYLLPHAKNPHRASTYVPLRSGGARVGAAQREDEDGNTVASRIPTDLLDDAPRVSLKEDDENASEAVSEELTDDAISFESETESVGSRASRATSFASHASGSRRWTFPSCYKDADRRKQRNSAWRTPFDQQSFIDLKQALTDVLQAKPDSGQPGDDILEEKNDIAVVSDGEDDDRPKKSTSKCDPKLKTAAVIADVPHVTRVTFED